MPIRGQERQAQGSQERQGEDGAEDFQQMSSTAGHDGSVT